MRDTGTPTKTKVLNQIADEIRKNMSIQNSDQVIQFSNQLFHDLEDSEIAEIGVQKLSETVISLWQSKTELRQERAGWHKFPAAYREHFSAVQTEHDIDRLLELTPQSPISLRFYNPALQKPNELRFKIYSADEHVVLSDVIPILENLGMRVLGEHPYQISKEDGSVFWISDFKVSHTSTESLSIEFTAPLIQQAFDQIWAGHAESDPFNQLIILTGLNWREVAVFRAYARYIKQLRFGFSQPFLAEALACNKNLTKSLIKLFHTRFNPENDENRALEAEKIESAIIEGLDEVESLDHDRILRRFLAAIKATVRTNYYQQTETGEFKNYFSFKLLPNLIPDIPLPKPNFEFFVYSPRVEGVHLRSGPVSRGGLRWSDRMEDYRTEVLGLVKAQQVKNSVIVPMGAKGCFIAKKLPVNTSREKLLAEGIYCYQTYIRGLLDLTDNLQGNEVIPPKKVVRHDDNDTYLVVAADKGTASFSDVANEIATQYGYWLGDAFASGGSQGYDHKKMGITARGAWESVKCHFHEKNSNTQSEEFSVVGIGDMGGDVFGNGMLLSKTIRLLAAFNHQHIFIDPDPDASIAFKERQRLFALPRSSWLDYDHDLISRGGGIFSRTSKSITITPEMQKVFDIQESKLTPNDLIRALLKAPIDMLWNGGIGTYVKASTETHAEVGDKANDNLRINGSELRCKVVGEGGNLGLTQRGRIEFASNGGAVNTDFIDNAGGVDCSDHEVNIKILLNEQISSNHLSVAERNTLLNEMTDEVAALVLKNNYRQALALRLAEAKSRENVDNHIRLIKRLEKSGLLNRELEFLPDEKALLQRKAADKGLSRPELSVLISYIKIELKQAIAASWLTQDEGFANELHNAFPETLRLRFPSALKEHRLSSEIIGTQVANDLINRMGITYVDKMQSATGASYSQIAAAYLCVREIYDIEKHWSEIEHLDGKVAATIQNSLYTELTNLIRRASHWFLRHHRYELNLTEASTKYKSALRAATKSTEALGQNIPEDRWIKPCLDYQQQGVPEQLSAFCASAGSQYWLLDIVDISQETNHKVTDVSSIYFGLGQELNLVWLDEQMKQLKHRNHWESLAALSYRNELDYQLRGLTCGILTAKESNTSEDNEPQLMMQHWKSSKDSLINRWQQTLADIRESNICDYAVFSVALSNLMELS
ncbi:MAG: NAD-glutamate dehydrogenase [Neptuniibacter sp.]